MNTEHIYIKKAKNKLLRSFIFSVPFCVFTLFYKEDVLFWYNNKKKNCQCYVFKHEAQTGDVTLN